MRSTTLSILAAIATLTAAGSRTARADDPVSSSVRYNREIVRIFERKCVSCHTNPGLSIPLDRYFDVRPWAQAIREEILERRMPPWPAAAGVRPLANELALTSREIAIITTWIDGGAPRGEPSDLPAPKPQDKWKAGEPDLELALPAQQVKPDGNPYVRRVTVATGLSGERWLRGFDIVPGERRALRSVFLYLQRSDGAKEWLGGWTPWYAMTQAPDNVGFRLPAGASLGVELHYAGWDEAEQPLTDASTMGLYFLAERPTSVVETLTVTAAAAAGSVRGEAVVKGDTVVWAVNPWLGRGDEAQPGAIEMRAITPGGGLEPLLWIKDHRSDWQVPYVLREPIRLPQGSRLVLTVPGSKVTTASATASVLTYRADAQSEAGHAGSLRELAAQPRLQR
jgi:hypothetical protein